MWVRFINKASTEGRVNLISISSRDPERPLRAEIDQFLAGLSNLHQTVHSGRLPEYDIRLRVFAACIRATRLLRCALSNKGWTTEACRGTFKRNIQNTSVETSFHEKKNKTLSPSPKQLPDSNALALDEAHNIVLTYYDITDRGAYDLTKTKKVDLAVEATKCGHGRGCWWYTDVSNGIGIGIGNISVSVDILVVSSVVDVDLVVLYYLNRNWVIEPSAGDMNTFDWIR